MAKDTSEAQLAADAVDAKKLKIAADKKKAAKKKVKKEVIVYTADQVELTKTQEKQVFMILKNEEIINSKKLSMVDTAIDSGTRLNVLKDSIQKKYGRVWKAWAELNLPVGYPQVSRYMKVAANQALIAGKTYTSLEDAVKLISFDGDEAAMAKSGTSKAAKRETADTQKSVAITPAALMEAIDAIDKVETLQQLRDYIQARIDGFGEGGIKDEDGEEDTLMGGDSVDDAADIADVIG